MSGEEDINKKFENILFSEENSQSIGYEEGLEIGKGRLENGYHFGYHRGSRMGAQLGYYCGTLEQYLITENCKSGKIVNVARQLLREIDNFPKFNDETQDILSAFDSIKFKFAYFCSLAKISPVYPEEDKLDF